MFFHSSQRGINGGITDGVGKLEVSKLFLHLRNHRFPDVVLDVEFLEVVPFLPAIWRWILRHVF